VVPPAYSIQMLAYGVFVVKRGGSASQTLDVISTGGFNQAVAFQCSGLPAGTTCSFSPATVTPDGTGRATPTQLTVSTTATASLREPPGRFHGVFVASLLLGLGGLFRRHRKANRVLLSHMGLWVVVTAAGLFGLAGCTTGSSLPSGQLSATVTVTGYTGPSSSPTATQTTAFVLTVE
jgi:hypothetical protein